MESRRVFFVAHLDEQNSSCPSWVGQVLCGMKNGQILGQCFNKKYAAGACEIHWGIQLTLWGSNPFVLSFFRWKNAVMPLVSRGGLFIYCFHVCIWTNYSSDRFFAFFGHLFKRWLFGIRESHQNPRQIHPTLGGLDWFNATWIGRKPLEDPCHLL